MECAKDSGAKGMEDEDALSPDTKEELKISYVATHIRSIWSNPLQSSTYP
jgi:hypothetical protein